MSTPLTEERKGEIALKYLKYLMRREGIKLSAETKREVGNMAKQIGISNEEAELFAEDFVREFVDYLFQKRQD